MRTNDLLVSGLTACAAVAIVAAATAFAATSGSSAPLSRQTRPAGSIVRPRLSATGAAGREYTIVDTGQDECFDDNGPVNRCPDSGERFHGQDAQHDGLQPSYIDNGDGTVTDVQTGMLWQKTPDFQKRTWQDSIAYCDGLMLAEQIDWELPTIKQLYSLIDFRGNSRVANRVPYIDTDYFDFQWGDVGGGDRVIDAQYWSRTAYVGTTMRGDATAFGVNFADGRIKGYPTDRGPGGTPFARYARCIRLNKGYGTNVFVDNGDGTITDDATGLMWMKVDNGEPVNWAQALDYAETLEHGGYSDWRLPNAKELHSIVDYSRAPDATDPSRRGPALDPVFDLSEDESWFWSGTTHLEGPGDSAAVYIAFGQAFGYMSDPSGSQTKMNVHGAGAQRSDPKDGDPKDYEGGLGPQGDEVRIFNYARAVRDAPTPAWTATSTVVATETPDPQETPSVTSNPQETASATSVPTRETSPPPSPTVAAPTASSTPTAGFVIYLPVAHQP